MRFIPRTKAGFNEAVAPATDHRQRRKTDTRRLGASTRPQRHAADNPGTVPTTVRCQSLHKIVAFRCEHSKPSSEGRVDSTPGLWQRQRRRAQPLPWDLNQLGGSARFRPPVCWCVTLAHSRYRPANGRHAQVRTSPNRFLISQRPTHPDGVVDGERSGFGRST